MCRFVTHQHALYLTETLQLPLVVFLSWAVFNDPMTATSLFGSCIIVGAAILVTLVKENGKGSAISRKASEPVYEPVSIEVDALPLNSKGDGSPDA